MNKLSLRLRITLITTCIIIGIAICLTLTSIGNARKSYIDNIDKEYNRTISNKDGSNISFSSDGLTVNDGNGNKVNIGKNGVVVEDEKGSVTTVNQDGINISTKEVNQVATKHFTNTSIIYMILIIILGIIATYFITGYTLRPVAILSDKIKHINENNLGDRIDNNGRKDEIGSLTDSFNHMLDRIEESFLSQKRFASNASHELKTPLAIMKTSIQVLQLEENPTIEDYKENLEITEKSTERLIRVVDDLLQLTKEGEDNFNEIISVQDTFDLIERELSPLALKTHITITKDITDTMIKGNQTLFYRALFNLVENAIKYNKPDGFVKLMAGPSNHGYEIKIADNGIGIPAESLGNIFDAFYRVDKSRSREIGGSGLGLSLVKTIIEKHGGTVSVESMVDIGTTFTIVFPSL